MAVLVATAVNLATLAHNARAAWQQRHRVIEPGTRVLVQAGAFWARGVVVSYNDRGYGLRGFLVSVDGQEPEWIDPDRIRIDRTPARVAVEGRPATYRGAP